MKYKILGPDDPALAVIQQQLINHPEWETELIIVPWAEYQPLMESSLKEETSTYQAICVPGHIWLPGLVKNNLLTAFDNLTPEIDQELINKYDQQDIIPSIAQECSFQGKQYILPLFTDGHLVFYRKDLITLENEHGVPIINPFDLPGLLNELNLNDHQYPIALKAHPSEILLDWLPYLWAAGGKIWDNNTHQPLFDSPEAVKALELYISLKTFSPEDTHLFGNQEIVEALQTGKVALATSWGGQAAVILNETNPFKDQYGTALFEFPWNTTWGISISENQPVHIKTNLLSVLYRAASPEQDCEVTRIAGSPVRKSSYSQSELRKYPWLSAQKEMLERCQTLPTDPEFSKYLGPLYEAVYQALTGEISPSEALSKVAKL